MSDAAGDPSRKAGFWRGTAVILATGFGLGYSPVASGTAGTLLGILIVMALAPVPLPYQVLVCAALSLLAIPICDAAEQTFRRKDDGRIVADEYLTFPICLLGIPWAQYPWMLAVAFVVCRVFDIVKPSPARESQRLKGGLGIVADDVIASLYALGVNHLVLWALCRLA